MNVVFYAAESGTILNTASGAQEIIEADGRPYVEVEEVRDDYDVTHRVVDGQLVAIGDDA
jgi:hypothetical protein